jgi:mRNA-degrading endonuclease RelE of RelBE toxin-antitoxin system
VYEVYLERAAERDLRKLPAETFHRIIPRINALAENRGLQDYDKPNRRFTPALNHTPGA